MKPKLGVLLCDQVSSKYRPEHPSYQEMFSDLLPGFQPEFYAVWQNQFPTDLGACDAWMATGSRRSVYDDIPWIKQMLNLIHQLKVEKRVFVGVCFGHQLLAHGLDGRVAKAEQGWSVGVHTINIAEQKSWMVPFREELNILMMCQDQVASLPSDAICLASTSICPVAMFSVADHMLGIQGHPEFSRAFVASLIADRIDLLGAEVAEKARESLDRNHQGKEVGCWITQFILEHL